MDYIVRKITETEEQLRASLTHPEYYDGKIRNLKPGSRRLLEVLAVRKALKELMGGEEQQVEYDAEGRPWLVPTVTDVPGTERPYLSFSHTRDYVAVITDVHPVGIDIERREQRVQRVTSHFLSEGELEMLAETPDYDLSLHLAWSAKEAAYKVLGHDYYDLQHRTTLIRIDAEARQLHLMVEGRAEQMILHYDYGDDYVLVWVSDSYGKESL